MEDMKFRLEFFFTCSFTYELIIKKLFWTLNKIWGQNLKRSAKKAKNLNSTFFELYIFGSANPRNIISNNSELLVVWY